MPLPNERQKVVEIVGLLGFIYDRANDKIYRFGTYTGAELLVEKNKFHTNELRNSSTVAVEIRDAQFTYSITAIGTREKALLLWAPKTSTENGKVKFAMERFVEEMLDTQVQVIVKRRSDGKVVFEGLGTNGGLEIQIP